MGWNIWVVVSVNIEKFIIRTATKRKLNPWKIRIMVKAEPKTNNFGTDFLYS